MTGTGRAPFQYALIRAVPRMDRGEFINVGVVLWCQAYEFLAAQVAVDSERLRALSPDADVEGITRAAEGLVLAAAESVGTARTSDGAAVRFGVLTAPRSSAVQPGPVHAGLTDDPPATLTRLMARLVRSG